MATVSQPASPPAAPAGGAGEVATGSSSRQRARSFVERNHFWLRRIHSLTGVVPVGGFLVYHFWENATALQAPDRWDEMATHARNIQLVLFIEFGLILLPLLYHAAYGLFIASYTRINVAAYSYARNRLFMWQRVTGIILVLYIIYHVMVLRFGIFANGAATYDIMAVHLRNPLVFAFYTAGILSAAYHFGNGLWTFLITWGITVGRRSQRVSQWVSTGIAVALSLLGMAIILTIVGSRGWFTF
ncbi:MAG TPA: succinate dehydrogenase [Chloroflexia bacterium]|nr:succinate dehydrogenase [Chloroflexia bacterium]